MERPFAESRTLFDGAAALLAATDGGARERWVVATRGDCGSTWEALHETAQRAALECDSLLRARARMQRDARVATRDAARCADTNAAAALALLRVHDDVEEERDGGDAGHPPAATRDAWAAGFEDLASALAHGPSTAVTGWATSHAPLVVDAAFAALSGAVFDAVRARDAVLQDCWRLERLLDELEACPPSPARAPPRPLRSGTVSSSTPPLARAEGAAAVKVGGAAAGGCSCTARTVVGNGGGCGGQ